MRAKRGAVVASLVGHQAPLGCINDRPVKLQNKTSQNNGSGVIQQIIGKVNAKHIKLGNQTSAMMEKQINYNVQRSSVAPVLHTGQASARMEGRDDIFHQSSTPCQGSTNGTHQ